MRFYNPGTKIDEKIQYTHPTKDPKEGSTLSYFPFLVQEKDFVDVPDTLMLDTPEGEVTVAVNFSKRIKQDYQNRGVILVDARLKNIIEDDNAAVDDKEARRKGDAMWRDYLKSICQDHYTRVQEIKSFGGVPRAAVGLTKYALNVMNMEDPGDQVDTITRAKEGQASNLETQQQIAQLLARINQLEGAKSAQGK
jgi:hypothetical protein